MTDRVLNYGISQHLYSQRYRLARTEAITTQRRAFEFRSGDLTGLQHSRTPKTLYPHKWRHCRRPEETLGPMHKHGGLLGRYHCMLLLAARAMNNAQLKILGGGLHEIDHLIMDRKNVTDNIGRMWTFILGSSY